MKSNPIRKFKTGNWFNLEQPSRSGSIRQWGYECPLCEVQPFWSKPYGTRKKAKDAYFKHIKDNHAGPGGCLGGL